MGMTAPFKVGQTVKISPTRREVYSGRRAVVVEVRDNNGPKSLFVRVTPIGTTEVLGYWGYELKEAENDVEH